MRPDRFEGIPSRYGYGSGYATRRPEPEPVAPPSVEPVRSKEMVFVPPPQPGIRSVLSAIVARLRF